MGRRIVVIGGVAAGTKAAAKARRQDQEAEILIIEKGKHISYGACGLPYYLSGLVPDLDDLMSTPAGVIRDTQFFKKTKEIDVLIRHEAIGIDRQAKKVTVRNLENDETSEVPYDRLILATGSTPFIPPIPGKDLKGVYTLQGIEDAAAIRAEVDERGAREVVIIGAGAISVESAENLVEAGCRVTIVEVLPQILAFIDEEMALLVQRHMESKGVRIITGARIQALEGEDDRVSRVVTDDETIPVDFVIIATGVRPNISLAEEAGIRIGSTGAIAVDRRMATNDPDIFAVGDCVENRCLVCQKDFYAYVPLGSTANKHGRVAAINACGGNATFDGVVRSGIVKAFDFNVARTGLSEKEAAREGFDVITSVTSAPDKAHFFPTAALIAIKLVCDRKSGKLLGAQIVGAGEVDKRINVVVALLTAGANVEDLTNLDLAYAPPYSPAVDNLIDAANTVLNKIEGTYHGASSLEVKRMIDEGADLCLLDVRSPDEYKEMRIPCCNHLPLGALRDKLCDVPKDQKVVAYCKTSLRAYEASLILKHHGYEDVVVLDGGVSCWPFEKESDNE